MEENKQEIQPNIAKRDEMIDKYIRRQAVLKNKFPEILKAPKSIQDEYFTLNSLIDSLQTSRREIWRQTIFSDGCQIDQFVEEKYEAALSKLSELNLENASYITPEDEASFKFPEIDFDGLREKTHAMETTEDYISLYNEIATIRQQPLPEDTQAKLYEIQKEIATVKLREQETPEINPPATVNESKFAQIYGKAKGKIHEVFGKIKSFFKQQSHDKNNDVKDLNDR